MPAADRRRRILFVSVHPPGRVPSQRFRFEQYVGYLAEHGFDTEFSPILREADYPVVYSPGGVARKAAIAARGAAIRLREALTASSYDVVVVQREAIQLGTAAFERMLGRSSAKLVFDFDDAIWIPDASEANRRLAWLKRPRKVAKIIAASNAVFAGNTYLADYASGFNSRVWVVPTTIDTDEYLARPAATTPDPARICIGWSGSPTTIKHFEPAIPVLRALRERFGDRVYFKVIGDGSYRNPELGIEGIDWRAETEVEDLSELDIGLMPLPDDPWAQGKCGLKGLQYMALGAATVMSPVGVNAEIIEDGRNGYLALATEEWIDKVGRLVNSAQLRASLGRAARETVIQRYSVRSQRNSYVSHFQTLLKPH